MSSTTKGNMRSGSRSNPEDMMWQGVRPKEKPNLINQQQTSTLVTNNDRLNQTNDQSRQKYGMPSIQGEQSVYNSSMAYQQPAFDKSNSLMSGTVKEEPNFPINNMNPVARKVQSLQQPNTLQSHQFATVVSSGDSIHERRSQQTSESRRSSQQPKMKKVDYSDISTAMVHQQRAVAMKGSRGQSLRGSRFTDPQKSMLQTMPVDHHRPNDPNSNAQRNFSSIDVNFKRQIDIMKQTRAQSMLPSNLAAQQNETPVMRGHNLLQHNDSIYQSSVNQSMNSGLGLTPKRLQIDNRQESTGRKAAPFGNTTEQKAYGNRVPPILLANENNMKYVGHNQQTQQVQGQEFTYSQQMSPNGQRHPGTAGHASFLSREVGSTAYSQPEDSMFQQSEASISQQRSRFPPNVLPKIGSANPEMNNRFKRTTAYPDSRTRDASNEQELRGRQLSTAQPKNGFKFSKSHVQSQQQRSRQTTNQYNDTGFNWRQVDIKTDKNFDGSGGTAGKPLGGTSASVHIPQAYRKPKKLSPGQLLDMMQQVDHKGPISHKIVNSNEFERLAQQQVQNDGGRPMVEKTIFIVKPIYIPVEVYTTKSEAGKEATFPLTGKKKIKVKNKVQKSIYMERPKPPNYTNSMSTTLEKTKSKKSHTSKAKRRQTQMIASRSPSPFTNQRGSAQYATEHLNQSSIDHGYAVEDKPDDTPSSRSKSKTKKDLKHLLESSTSVIDQIFKKREIKVEAARKKEEEKIKAEEKEFEEVVDANKGLKDSLRGKGSMQSKMTLQQQLSGDPSSGIPVDDKSSTGKPVDTTKEFLTTINDQLHTAGAGIQIIMEESKDARWFTRKQKDQERLNKKYDHVRKWEVAPKTFEASTLDAETLNAAKSKAMNRGSAVKGGFSHAQMSGQKSINGTRAEMSRSSIPKFTNNPSGGEFSERRWKSPTQQSNDSQLMRRGNSLSPRDENKSPITVRSGRGSIESGGCSRQHIISVQDQKNNMLSLERVEAMKVMTNKLRKVAKMPIEMENKFCSHLDPGTSAQLIAADDLAKLTQNTKFGERWKDKEHVGPRDDFNNVPKHYYRNFKSNLIRDAHYMAKEIISQNRSMSPMQNTCLGDCQAAANEGNSIPCNCKPKKKVDLRHKFRSFNGGVKSKLRSKNVEKTAYDLYKPYRPCRRTCCANHNPLFHAQRMQQEHLQRMHASATKLMIMSVIPERPYSADSAQRALKQYQTEIDYFQSTMHDDAIERRKSLRLKKQGSKRQNSFVGIAERGANEEEDPQMSKKSIGTPGVSTIGGGSIGKFTQSNMNLMQNKLNGSFMMDDSISLTAIECKYLLSVLKNRAIQANQIKDNQFNKIYEKARMTLKIQMKKLLLKKQFYIIDKQYKLAENEKQTAENLIKILARISRMYEAQESILKIINLITTRLASLKEFRIEQHREEPDGQVLKKLYFELVRVSGRTLAEIRILKTIEKTLSRPFMFNGTMYDLDFMHLQMKRKRLQILGQLPELGDCNELKMFLLVNGEMSDVRNMNREETELKEDEPLWSSSEEADSEDEEVGQDEFKTLNKLNDNSQEKLEKLASVELKRNTTI